MLQHIQKTSTSLCCFCIDKADNGILQIGLIYFSQVIHRFVLCIFKKLEQHLTVNCKVAVEATCLTNNVTVVLFQSFKEEFLIFFFRHNRCVMNKHLAISCCSLSNIFCMLFRIKSSNFNCHFIVH